MLERELRLTPLEVGPLPSDWRVTPIGKVSEKVRNGFVGKSVEHQVTANGVLYLQGFNIRPGRVDLSKATYVSHDFHQTQEKSQLKSGDILVVQSGHIGTCARIPDQFPIANCHALIIIDPMRHALDPDFLVNYLNSDIGQRRMQGLFVGSSMPHINTSELAEYRIPLPPLAEQRRIARILRAWDEAIETSTGLIAATNKRAAALSRQLFAPCHPTFEDRPRGYREFKLGEVFLERDESGGDGDILLSITMSEGVIDRADVGRKDTSNDDKSAYKLVLPGDIGYNTMRMWQGVSGLSELRGLVSPAYTVVTPDNRTIAGRYAAHLFKSRRMVFDFERYSQGLTSDTWNLKFPAFSKIKVFLPSFDTQTRQFAILDALKDEIAALERQRDALAKQKRGLMQKLLTGEWRVKEDAKVAA